MSDLELRIVKLLSAGLKQVEIPNELKIEGFESCSLATIEKTIKSLKNKYKAKSNFHLAVLLTKEGIL